MSDAVPADVSERIETSEPVNGLTSPDDCQPITDNSSDVNINIDIENLNINIDSSDPVYLVPPEVEEPGGTDLFEA